MKDRYGNMDEYFRDKLKDLELDPPEHVWENVRKEISSGSSGGGSIGNGGIAGLTVLVITVGSFFLLFNRPAEKQAEALIASAEEVMYAGALSQENLIAEKQDPESNTSHAFDTPDEIPSNDRSPLIPEDNTGSVAGAGRSVSSNADQPEQLSGGQNSDLREQTVEPDLPGNSVNLIENNSTSGSDRDAPTRWMPSRGLYQPEIKIELRSVSGSLSDRGPSLKSNYISPSDISFGFFFTPEIILYPDDNSRQNRSYSFDLHAIYRNSGYILQSGIGVAFSDDDGDYTVNFEKYLGSYEDVYNITFDSAENGIQPIYHTQTVDVYDSIKYLSVSETRNRYTYLQVPLLFGYGKEYRRLGWYVKGGPSFSLLIHEKIPGVDFPEQDIRILRVDDQAPQRIKTHWQFMASAGISYRLSGNLRIVFEPVFRYYLRSAYQRNLIRTKHPYSLGVRTGFLINF
mgnify:CR=1 FL=1